MKTGLRSTLFSLAIMATASVAVGQDASRNLADIRTELQFLSSQIQGLRSELVESGAAQSTTASGPALMRVDAIEAELRTLTGQVEQIQFRIEQIAKDATNRVGDLEFRLTELEGGDASIGGQTRPLGGSASTSTPTSSRSDIPDGVELTVVEKSDYEAAIASLSAENFELAAQQFDAFIATFPGGPLTSGAQLHKGEALAGMGDWKSAGRSFLDSFSSAPAGNTAPQALYKLGVSLGRLNKTSEACKTLSEVEARFPADPAVTQANGEMQTLGCS